MTATLRQPESSYGAWGYAYRRLKKFLDKLALRRSILPKSLLGKAISYALGQWSRLEVYLTDGRVEIDNNWIENAIRPTKIGANYAKLRNMQSWRPRMSGSGGKIAA